MAGIKLFTGELPKGQGGRKARTPDADLLAALVKTLKDNPLTENGRPTIVGDASRLFDSEGKASSDGRVYGRAIAEDLDKTVRVRTVESAEGSGKWGWTVYIPAVESKATDAENEAPAE